MNSCWLFHDWPKWTDRNEGAISVREDDGSKRIVGDVITQERRCNRCNMVVLRMSRASLNLFHA